MYVCMYLNVVENDAILLKQVLQCIYTHTHTPIQDLSPSETNQGTTLKASTHQFTYMHTYI